MHDRTVPIDVEILTNYLAGVAAETTLSSTDLRRLRIQFVADAGATLLVLLLATTLSVYKPRGMTRYGTRKKHEQGYGDDTGMRPDRVSNTSTPRWVKMFWIVVIVLVLVFVILHITGHGLGGHTSPFRGG